MQGSGVVDVSKDAGKICASPSEPRGPANSECSAPFLLSMHFVLTRLQQNVGEFVHDRYEPRRSFHVPPFVESLAEL
jgi:hypothetical protein